MANAAIAQDLKTITVDLGYFWCVKSDVDTIPGVVETASGYTGGTLDNPTYQLVTAGGTGHDLIRQNQTAVTYHGLAGGIS